MNFTVSPYAIPGIPRAHTITDIKNMVAYFFNMPVEQMDLKTRKREIVQPRQIAMFFSKHGNKGSLAEIGEEIGNKDHATVLHACKTVNNLYDTDKKFRSWIDKLSSKMDIKFNFKN